jgi:hypothetical protein
LEETAEEDTRLSQVVRVVDTAGLGLKLQSDVAKQRVICYRE